MVIGKTTGFATLHAHVSSLYFVADDNFASANRCEAYAAKLMARAMPGRTLIRDLYSEVSGDIDGDQYRIWTPTTGAHETLIVFCHGSGESLAGGWVHNSVDGRRQISMRALSEGYSVAYCDARGESWGNQSSVDAVSALVARARSLNPGLTKVIFYGHSMGGAVSVNAVVRGGISGVAGWMGTDAVANLQSLYDHGYTGVYDAYGVAPDGSDFAAKTAGYDPIYHPASAFAGLRMRWYASPDDTAVTKSDNSDTLHAVAESTAAEAVIVTQSGVHGSPFHFIPLDDFSAFWARCRGVQS
jgi:pimeloyl-ACP methyl ester carboxylesterase